MKILQLLLLVLFTYVNANSQENKITGTLLDQDKLGIIYANVTLLKGDPAVLVKVETTDVNGVFAFRNIPTGTYTVAASYVGLEDMNISNVSHDGSTTELGELPMNISGIALETATVTATRALVEIKPDRTVFNVQGTINSAGDNGLSLMRKAPGVTVDNNNNISVLSRSGVLIYIDGRRLPLTGDELSGYLESLPAEQIDRIDIITNPGAKYEAEGNAGIIDIRLKKDKNLGSNGTISSSISQGQKFRGNLNASGNYRNTKFNTFGSLGYQDNQMWNKMAFNNSQNGLFLAERNLQISERDVTNYRWGADYFVSENGTLGFLISGNNTSGNTMSENIVEISSLDNINNVDSILVADNLISTTNKARTYNLNYAYRLGENSLNIDFDYGSFDNEQDFMQPNEYYDNTRTTLLSTANTAFDTPTYIDIYTAKLDYETNLSGGKLGIGTKFSKVVTDNTFLHYDVNASDIAILNNEKSNIFKYDENVYAAYANYIRKLNAKWSMTAGLRVELTDAEGELTTFADVPQDDPVLLDYVNYFPTAGLTYTMSPAHVFSLNYGRRINRPDYNVLNPFRTQLSELSFSKGNESLRPEIVNNIELGYTLKYRYNFKLSYSKTLDQITRLIGPDEIDPRASFIGWDNLAEQTVYGLNITTPLTVNTFWDAFINVGGSYINNQADYGDGAIVDVQAWSYTIYQQHTFKLPNEFKAEVSGYYSGPGVWGGVFEYETTWSLNLGLQRKFLNNNMNVRIAANDIFFQSGWEGFSVFDGLRSEGNGAWDSRRVSLSVSYNFGNNNVKSRKRQTGIESETKRVGS